MIPITAEILTVGTEILLGNIVNSNAAFLSQELAKLGIAVYTHTSVGDNHGRLAAAMGQAMGRADIVITTGGLGPTLDDITKPVAADFFGLEMEIHAASHERILERYKGRALPENVERNALVPKGASVLPNDNGAAPGICIERDGKTLIMLPGPPYEMQPMFKNYGVALLKKNATRVFVSRTIKIIGMGETAVESQLRDLIEAQENPTIAPYAKLGEVHIRLTASAADESAANALLSPTAEEIHRRLGEKIYAEDETTLAETIIALLKSKSHTLAVAESCTGGMISSDLTAIAGCSEILREGFVTYSNEAKTARLSVGESILQAHGAVSAQTAAAMAEGAAKAANTTIGLSTTGIAGPDGGTAEKPVGTVHIGLYIEGEGTKTVSHHLTGQRNEVRKRTAILALDFLRLNLRTMP
ncbi:MAG: competence/damage-inducible protein A [Defluviitaleaceae bacterium]|nr:competence/damage-inducible protein A [Defluviitaleaceae bacterium]